MFSAHSILRLILLCVALAAAELHHQRALPRDSNHAGVSDTLSQHANESRASFAIGDHLVSWLNEQRFTSRHQTAVTADDVVFVVMASQAKKQRVATQRATWMRWAEHIFVFADAADPELGIITLPEIANKPGFEEAQFRQLRGMQWLHRSRPELARKKWIFLVDDDTWVNVPALLEYITAFPPNLPLAFSHIYLRRNRALFNGGAGMLLSHEAFSRIAPSLFTNTCSLADVPPNEINNDNILAACAYFTGVLKVTSSKFGSYGGTEFLNPIDDAGWLDQITLHKVTDRTMAETMWCWVERLHGHPVQDPCQSIADFEHWT